MTTTHTTPPNGARFVMLTLESGAESVGWFDSTFGFHLKSSMGEYPKVKSWRELTEHERNSIGLNE